MTTTSITPEKAAAAPCCGPTCCGPSEKLETPESLRSVVREKYGAAATRVTTSTGAATCCNTLTGDDSVDPITAGLYASEQIDGIPEDAFRASLGCGNPTMLASLAPGERVLDLGSGGGIDVLLSAKRVGPTGKAYGLDMTDEMLALARSNQAKSGLTNVEFLRGQIENIPLPNEAVDVIISNCVINLSADKPQVMREAFRVLAPGGRFAVSDVVLRDDIPEEVRESVALFTGCVGGALTDTEYRAYLTDAGFTSVDIEPTRVYSDEDGRKMLTSAGLDVESLLPRLSGRVMSAFVRAEKPQTA